MELVSYAKNLSSDWKRCPPFDGPLFWIRKGTDVGDLITEVSLHPTKWDVFDSKQCLTYQQQVSEDLLVPEYVCFEKERIH